MKQTNNMRKFNNYEAVKINNAEEAMEFLQYLEDNTDLKWWTGENPTEANKTILTEREFPIFIEVDGGSLCIVKLVNELDPKTKIIPLSEFLEPKTSYSREQAEKVFKDYNRFHNTLWSLSPQDIAFLNHKFPKPTLEQVTEAVKDLGDFKIEQTTSGDIIISPIDI